MKNTFFLVITVIITQVGSAQDLQMALKEIYYQRTSSAKSILKQLCEADPARSEAAYWLSEIYLAENKRDSARQVLQNAVQNLPDKVGTNKSDPFVYIGQAHLLLDEDRRGEAGQLISEILGATKSRDPAVLLAAARAHIESENGNKEYALELLEKAAKRDKKNPQIFSAMGDAYRKLIDGSNAVPKYDLAIAADPAFAEAMYKKGLIYNSQKNTEIALDRFTRANQMDSVYAPAIYELYYHYFSQDVTRAGKLLEAYIRYSDPSPALAYMVADYLYVSGNYLEAVTKAKALIERDGDNLQPRIYKLLGYSYAATGDSASAWTSMKKYFQKQNAKDMVSPDYDFMALLTGKLSPDKAGVIDWYKKALASATDEHRKLDYMITLAEKQKELGNTIDEAVWREKVYKAKVQPGNLDIYNWGLALFSAENYARADSVFSLYEEKYPDQVYGYLWRARCNALKDSAMEKGLAVPHYQKLVAFAEKDSITYKATLLSAYGYLGTYEANITKDYPASLGHFEKMLRLEPSNTEAEKYAGILRRWIGAAEGNQHSVD